MTQESDAPTVFDAFDRFHDEFRQREEERARVRDRLEPILSDLTTAESELSKLNVFGIEERFRLARARVEILQALRSLSQSANDRSENNHRALESFRSKGR